MSCFMDVEHEVTPLSFSDYFDQNRIDNYYEVVVCRLRAFRATH